jgi:hypothetical protein
MKSEPLTYQCYWEMEVTASKQVYYISLSNVILQVSLHDTERERERERSLQKHYVDLRSYEETMCET